jgi:hypothetical protein
VTMTTMCLIFIMFFISLRSAARTSKAGNLLGVIVNYITKSVNTGFEELSSNFRMAIRRKSLLID